MEKKTSGKLRSVRDFVLCYDFESLIHFIVYGRKSSNRLSQPCFTGFQNELKVRGITVILQK